MDKANFRSGKGPIIISIILSIPIILLATFIFSTPPAQVIERNSKSTTETSTSATETSTLDSIRVLDSLDEDYARPIITTTGGNAYFVWMVNNVTDRKSDISFAADTINRTRNLSENTGNAGFPQIAAAGDNAYVVWQDSSTGNSAIYFIEVK